ncbi:uncharacterized protein TNCV_514621 [Trichonephila clavipes]|nr:uncharacterized protein TNCV_514621 [Trichonephila clavipes]
MLTLQLCPSEVWQFGEWVSIQHKHADFAIQKPLSKPRRAVRGKNTASPNVCLLPLRRRCCALSATARLRDSAASLSQWFLYLSETPCKLHTEDAELWTVRVSQQPVKMPDILPDVDAELGTALVSQQLCELHHAPPVQAFAVRLAETFR